MTPEFSLQKDLEHLSLQIGERHLGSEGEARAQAFLASRFEELGYEVIREEFDAPGWRYRGHEVTSEEGGSIEAFPCFYSPGGTVCAPLKLLRPGKGMDLRAYAGTVAFAGAYDFQQVGDTNALAEALERAGAVALILNSPYNDTFSTKIVRSPNLERMPVLTLSQREALRLARQEGRPVRITVDAGTFPHRSANIVGRYRPGASEGARAERKLVIGAHYDTSPGIPGAVDNASGVAAMLLVAERLRPLLPKQGWEVDFVAFGGEEYGGPGYGIGGYAYWQAHATEPIKAMICLDGMGSYLGAQEVRVGRSRRLKRIVREETAASAPAVTPFRKGSDQGIFDEHGVPTAWWCEGGPANGVRHFPLHSPQDALDLVEIPRLGELAGDVVRVVSRVLAEGLEEVEVPDPDVAIVALVPEAMADLLQLVAEVWTMGSDASRERHYGRVLDRPWREKIAASVEDYLGREEVRGVVLKVKGRFAGFISWRKDPATGLGEIGYNAVDPAFAGKGYGRLLLENALVALREEGVTDVEVVTGLDDGHAPARAVYESAGFRPLQSSIRYALKLSATP